MSLLVRTSTDNGALLVRDTDDPFALSVTESTSPLALRVRESTSPLAMRVRGLFSPASLPGLAAWYDASDSSTVLTTVSPDVPASDGQTVRRWLDKSGNGRHLEQADLANQPIFTNAATGLTFNGTTATMGSAAFTAVAQPLSIYIVARVTNSNNRIATFDNSSNANNQIIVRSDSVLQYNFPTPHISTLSVSGVLSVLGVIVNNTASRAFRNTTTTSDFTLGTGTMDRIFLGARGTTGNNFMAGNVTDFLVYAAAHDAATQARLSNYLFMRRGITP
jgi:hypothetical protein